MTRSALAVRFSRAPAAIDILALLKPITWFPPMWAFLCGAVSSGAALGANWLLLVAGVVLTGPLVCGTSQAVNDWFDRHVDAINEPCRPIPSGRVPGRWGLAVAMIGTAVSLLFAASMGWLVLAATAVALACGWVYSAPPFRLKASGWWGPGLVGLSYEGLSWFTGAALLLGAMPRAEILIVLLLYSLGAHGIMTLNDFKALAGDRATGVRSLPVVLGPDRAARMACAVMAVPQAIVALLLVRWEMDAAAGAVALSIVAQLWAMTRLLRDPARWAPWYNGTGVTLYVLGMLTAAIGLSTL
jgi:chlorophyll/bacteriochlorophyll a synthase